MSSGDMWLAGVPGIRVEYIRDPNDIVNLAEGTPYTVPAGMVLIITDWVTTDAEVDLALHEKNCIITITRGSDDQGGVKSEEVS